MSCQHDVNMTMILVNLEKEKVKIDDVIVMKRSRKRKWLST